MKKTLLLCVTAVLAGTLLIACAQPESPSSLTITNLTPGTEGVAADKIKAESFDGAILVTWEAVTDAASYSVWRREWKADGTPDEGTINRVANNSSNSSALRKIPYYLDTANIKNGTSYQYGVVVNSYKTSGTNGDAVPRSEIVWQAVSDENPAGKGQNVIETATTGPVKVEQSVIDTVKGNVKAGITYYDTSTQGASGSTNLNNRISAKITGLTLGYTYTFYYQYVNTGATVVDSDWGTTSSSSSSGWTNNQVSSITYTENYYISTYLDTGYWTYEPVLDFSSGYNDYSGSTPYQYWKGRLVVKVELPGSTNKYQTVKTPATAAEVGIASNEKIVTTLEVN